MNIIVLICIIALAMCEVNSGQSESTHEIALKSIQGASKVLNVYEKNLDKIIPWETFHKIATKLEEHRGKYSEKSGTLVGEIVTFMLNSENHYFAATQSIYNWCGKTIPFMEAYLELFTNFDQDSADAQRELLKDVLTDGIIKMNDAVGHLNQSIVNFDAASGKLYPLDNQLAKDFNLDANEQSTTALEAEKQKIRDNQYYPLLISPIGGAALILVNELDTIPNLEQSIDQLKKVRHVYREVSDAVSLAKDEISKARDEIKREIIILGNLKSQTETTQGFMNYIQLALRKRIEKHTNNLIGECLAYRNRHGKV